MADIIIFAIITALLFWKLKGILGKEDENFTPRKMKFEVKDVTGTKQGKDASSMLSSLIDLKKDSKDLKQPNIEEEVEENLKLIPASLHQNYKDLCKLTPSGILLVKNFLEGVETIFVELINSQNTKETINIEAFISSEFLKFFKDFLQKQKLESPNKMINLITVERIEFVSIANIGGESIIKLKMD